MIHKLPVHGPSQQRVTGCPSYCLPLTAQYPSHESSCLRSWFDPKSFDGLTCSMSNEHATVPKIPTISFIPSMKQASWSRFSLWELQDWLLLFWPCMAARCFFLVFLFCEMFLEISFQIFWAISFLIVVPFFFGGLGVFPAVFGRHSLSQSPQRTNHSWRYWVLASRDLQRIRISHERRLSQIPID